MTHDELLAKIDEYEQDYGCACDLDCGAKVAYKALYAVTELHSEQEVTLPDGEWGILCDYCSDYGVYVLYPCKTIRAIEKELK